MVFQTLAGIIPVTSGAWAASSSNTTSVQHFSRYAPALKAVKRECWCPSKHSALFFFFFYRQTHDSKEHLAMMERVLGPIPSNLLQKTRSGIVFRGKPFYTLVNLLPWVTMANVSQTFVVVQETAISPPQQAGLGC